LSLIQSQTERRALQAGIVFAGLHILAVLYVVFVVTPLLGPADAPVAERAQKIVQYASNVRLGNFLITSSLPFFLIFVAGLGAVIRRLGATTLSLIVVVAGAAKSVIWPIGLMIADAAIGIARAGGENATVVTLASVAPFSLAFSAWPRAVMAMAATTALQQERVGPSPRLWLGWLVAATSVLGTLTPVVPQMFLVLAGGTILFDLWVMSISFTLMDSRTTPGSALE